VVRVVRPSRIPNLDAALLRRVLRCCWALYGGPPVGRLDIVFLDRAQHTRLHEDLLGDPRETDVMALPYEDPDLYGEILVNRDRAMCEARRRRLPPWREGLLYCVHGSLHLLGFRDDTPASARAMRAAEKRVLKTCIS